VQGLAAAEVAAAVQLEQWLMEGAYNKVLAAKAGAAGPDMALLLDQLARTVR
jgi:26S proteasome regulatory subunit N12